MGAIGLAGVFDDGARVVALTEAEAGIPPLLAPDHGAAVVPTGGPVPGVAHRALVPPPCSGRAVVVDDEPASGTTGRA